MNIYTEIRNKDSLIELCDKSLLFSFTLLIFSIPLSESIKNIAFGMTLFFWLAKILLTRQFKIRIHVLGWFHIGFLITAILSAFFAINVYQGFRGVWDIFRYLAVFLIIINNVDSEDRVRVLTAVFLISISIGCVWGIYESLKETDYYLSQMTVHSLGHQNHTATYLLIMFSLALGLLIKFKAKPFFKLTNFFVLLLLGISIILTDSRTALVTLFVILSGFIFVEKKWKIIIISSVLLFSVFAGVFIFSSYKKNMSFGQELLTGYKGILNPLKDPFIQQRLRLWKKAIGLVEKNPFLGIGTRNFNLSMVDKNGQGPSHAHNVYLNVAAETGLLGFSAFFLWLSCYFYTWVKLKKQLVSDMDRSLWLAVLGSFITITVSGLATTTLHTEGAMVFTSMIGLMIVSQDDSVLNK